MRPPRRIDSGNDLEVARISKMHAELREVATDRLVLWTGGPEVAARVCRYHADNWAHLRRWSTPVPPDFLSVGYWEPSAG